MSGNGIVRKAMAAGLAASLAGCASKPAPRPAPPPRQAPATVAVRPPPPRPATSDDWRDFPLTPGAWTYRSEARGSEASFGPAGVAPVFSLRCDAARRQILLVRPGSGGPLRLRTSFGERVVAAAAGAEGASLPASDPLLDQMAFSRGRFTVEAAGLPMLVIPAWPEPARVVEDCRE